MVSNPFPTRVSGCPRCMLARYKRNKLFHWRSVGQGIYNDLRQRRPYYISDFTDAFNYRVIPSTVFMFFTNLLPAIAFAQDMFDKTDNSFGVNEVLMASAMGGIIFGLFAGQPLCIVGVTGPISIFYYTVYDLIQGKDIPFFPFMCWICIWSMGLHVVLALLNLVSFLKFITAYSCDVFGFFISVVYIQKGIQILSHQFTHEGPASGFASVCVAIVMTLFGLGAIFFGTRSHYINPLVRKAFADYGLPLSVVFFTGFIHFGGYLDSVNFQTLPITKSFHPTLPNRPNDWFVRFWEDITVSDVFLALPFAILLTVLFYFDHNVSSLMCQGKQFPLKKPASFHWDFFLLGITTGVAGFLGIPPPSGLIPQAPLHTLALCVFKYDYSTGKNYATGVVEQRVSNTVQGLMILGLMTRPLLVVLGTIPQAVLSGLFFVMGITGLNGNEITRRLRFLGTDPKSIPHKENDLARVDKKWLILFVIFELIAFAFEFGITCTRGAVGFPGVLMFFAAFAVFFPKIFPADQLAMLDSPAAEEFIMKNLEIRRHSKSQSTASSKPSEESANDGGKLEEQM